MSDLDLDAMWTRVAAIGDASRGMLMGLDNEIRRLAAEVERLKANQQPDGGEWVVEYATESGDYWHDEFSPWCEVQRQVWYGHAEPIAAEAAE